ncbi:MAG: oligosaccharide flippase family protein, partial [Candidatus Neomarinimicrobiota bacterium]
MTSSIRSLTKQTLIYGVGTILARFVTFLLLPLYTNILPTADYGLAALVFAFIGFLIIIFNYGLDSSVMRFYGENADRERKTRMLSTAIWVTLASSLVLGAIIYSLDNYLGRVLLNDPAHARLIRL